MKVIVVQQPTWAERVASYLPPKAADAIRTTLLGYDGAAVTEVRLRAGRYGSLSLDRVNLPFRYAASAETLSKIVARLCGGTLYASEAELARGTLPFAGGGRVSVVCGTRTSGGKELPDLAFSSVVFRLPHHSEGESRELAALFRRTRANLLIYAPPAVGKTTFLRDLAIELSRGPDALRVVLLDRLGELDDGRLPCDALIDVVRGRTAAEGIRRATATLAPEVILCDELGAPEDVGALGDAATRGTPVIATCHGVEMPACYRFAFPLGVALRREPGEKHFTFTATCVASPATARATFKTAERVAP